MQSLKTIIERDKGLWKKIIKCIIAYEIGTIIILIPKVSDNVGVVPYLVTLGTLFFNASGTAGNQITEMLLNILVMLLPCVWCAIVSYLCTLYNSHIQSASLYSNGAGIFASIAFFISVFITAYYRLKYPRLFIPALQGFTIPFFGLTKGIYDTHFNVMAIVGIFYPVLIGGGIALVVNLLLWPETAAKVSENSFGSALQSIQNVLECVECQVLKECDVVFSDLSASKKLRQIIQTLDGDISKMQTARKEAKYEIVISHYCPVWYKSLAKIMESLSRNLYGLSLAVEREGRVILYQKVNEQLSQQRNLNNAKEQQEQEQHLRIRKQLMDQNRDTVISRESDFIAMATSNKVESGGTISRIEYKLISKLQSSVQPEIKKFIQICISVIRCIRHRLRDNGAIPKSQPDTHTCAQHSHEHDLKKAMESLKQAKIILQREYEERRAEPKEDHFLIYTVLFSLSQFGKKLMILEKEADQLIAKRTSGRFSRVFFPRVNFRKWLGEAGESAKGERSAAEQVLFDQQNLLQREETRTRKQENHESTTSESLTNTALEEEEVEEKEGRSKSAAGYYGPNGAIEKRLSMESDWIDDDDQQETPLQNAPGPHVWNRWLHSFNEWYQTDPVRYAIKFAITMELLALMAWLPIPGVNTLYNNNHGQWALLSAMVVFNFTVGSTALQCLFRVLATIIGAVAGYICLLAANRNERPYALAIMTLVFQIPMWYLLLGSKYPRIGFISLLTMAVITSTGYTDKFAEDLFAPVWKRSLTAILAIIVVLIVDQVLWPVWARKMVRKHLSDLLIATGIQFSKVASLVCQENTLSYRYTSTLKDAQMNVKILKKQHQLTCQMLGLAAMEPRITKGAFPIQIYSQILEHERHILYWIEHLLMTQKFISTDVRKKIMNPMNPYRKEMAAAVHLYLFTLAGSLRTKSSLPASLPSAEIARQILQQRQAVLWHENFDELNEITSDGNGETTHTTTSTKDDDKECDENKKVENQIYWQTYAAGSVEVIVEQESMGALVAKLMGQHVFKAATKDWIA